MNDMVKNLLLWLVIAAVLLSVFNNFNMQSPTEQVGYSEFIQEIQRDQVKKVEVDGLTISGERYDGSRFETIRPMVEDPKLIDDLLEHKVEVIGRKPEQQSVWTQLLVASFPILIIIALFFFFNGWVASSRLFTRSHTFPELTMGLLVGVIPQLTVMNMWL